MKNGVFLARFQPLHNGHLFMIKKALKDCDHLLIVLGSANKKGMKRNPFDIERRKAWLKASLKNKDDFDRITIIELPDWSTENDNANVKEWGTYLYMNIVSRIFSKKFSIYYNDDIDIIMSWFEKKYLDNINICHLERNNIFEGLSATKIRNAFLEDNKEYVEKFCPQIILDQFDEIKEILEYINKNPKEDFVME